MGTPRTLHGAMKRGWFPVEVPMERKIEKNVSHVGLCIWADRNSRGKFLSDLNRNTSAFVFEYGCDASWFILRWS